MVSRPGRLKSIRGFTLIEMLISLGIFAIITGFVMANFRIGSQSDELRAASQLVASAIRRVQTAAIAGQTTRFCRSAEGVDGKVCPSGSDAECGGDFCVNDVPRGGYGLRFEATEAGNRTMVTFADTNGNGVFDAVEETRRDSISPNVYVNVTALVPAVLGPALDIVFVPPKPSVKFNGSATEPIATITLQHRSTQQTKTVTVNSISGQVNTN